MGENIENKEDGESLYTPHAIDTHRWVIPSYLKFSEKSSFGYDFFLPP